jgi:hypothetical protein
LQSLFLGAEVAFDHLVVFVLKIYVERLTWDEFIQDPSASCLVKDAGWNWEKLLEIANSVKQSWREAEEALLLLKEESKGNCTQKRVRFAVEQS